MKRQVIQGGQQSQTLKTSYSYKQRQFNGSSNDKEQSVPFRSSHEICREKQCIIKEENCLLCPNCINRELITAKEHQRQKAQKDSAQEDPSTYSLIDRLRHEKEERIADQINKRELNAWEIGKSLCNFQVNAKEDLIAKQEQGSNCLMKETNYDCYLRARQRQMTTEAAIHDSFNKHSIRNNDKDEYYLKYVDQPYVNPYLNANRSDEYQLSLKRYHDDLRKQIEDNQINRSRKYRQEQLADQRQSCANEQRILKEYNEIEVKRRNDMNRLREENEMIIKAKCDKLNRECEREKEDESRLKKRMDEELSYYNKVTEDKKNKMKEEYQQYINTFEKDKEKKMRKEKSSSSLGNHLLIGDHNRDLLLQCSVCHKQFPKHFLTKSPPNQPL